MGRQMHEGRIRTPPEQKTDPPVRAVDLPALPDAAAQRATEPSV
ncbi:hypothetical protein HMPREF9062_2062 [Actinomyces sp. oral taxon 448 str. F0400]|nr:hypothetical protein HMPREF9062_2062 [Actinomyces sp. oral taxon 448 str. F0400]